MVLIPVRCPHCRSEHIIKGGKTKAGTQPYKCLNTTCPSYSFQLDLIYKGRCPTIKEQIVDMALNGSGIRDMARVLQISPNIVLKELKKESTLVTVQVVTTGITPQLATSERLRAAETEPRHHVGPSHTPR